MWISIRSSGTPWARPASFCTSRACTSASGEPRLPIRRNGADCNAVGSPLIEMARLRPQGQPEQCGFWASKRAATRPPPRSSSGGPTARGAILSNIVRSQLEEHAPYGGVVPELAARAHVSHLDHIIARASARRASRSPISTASPRPPARGSSAACWSGSPPAKALAAALGKPLIAVNHLEAHALTARLTDGLEFPYLLLLVSGGHSQFVLVRGVGDYERWGTTIDDALGEAFDKVAKLLDLGVPGGPEVERRRGAAIRSASNFRARCSSEERLDFSFSGLKTAVRLAAEADRAADADRTSPTSARRSRRR